MENDIAHHRFVQFELISGFTVKKSANVIPWPITIALHVSPA
jgi:hypothetical protein